MTRQQLRSVITGLEWLVALMLVLNLNSVYHTILNSRVPTLMDVFLYLLIGLLGVVSFFNLLKNNRVTHNLLLFIAFYGPLALGFVIINLVVSHSTSQQIFINFVAIPLLLIVYMDDAFAEKRAFSILAKIEKIVFFIAAVSLGFWLFSTVIPVLKATSTIQIFWGPGMTIPSFFGMYFQTQSVTVLGHSLMRNTAIFTEAPQFACLLSLAVVYNVFLAKKPISKNKILTLAAITTGSVTGIATIIAAFGVEFYRQMLSQVSLKPEEKRKIKIIANMVVGIAFVLIGLVVANRVMYGAASVSARTNDIYAGLHAWLHHPWIGNGVGNYVAITDYMTPARLLANGNSGFSSGIMSTLAYGGLYWGAFFLIPLICILYKGFKKRLKGNLIIYALFIFLLLTFTIINNTLMFVFISMFEWGVLLFNLESQPYFDDFELMDSEDC